MIVAIRATCSDSSSRSAISSMTGRSVHIELPKSSVRHADHPVAELGQQRLVETEPLALQLDRFLA